MTSHERALLTALSVSPVAAAVDARRDERAVLAAVTLLQGRR
jgi:hypothetical protein